MNLDKLYEKLIEVGSWHHALDYDFDLSRTEDIQVSFDKYQTPIRTIVGRVNFYQSNSCGDGCCSWSGHGCLDYDNIVKSNQFNNEELAYIRKECGI